MTRVVVVGSGIAGLSAALEAHAAGADATVLTKGEADASNTRFAQGGIAAVTAPDDSLASHIDDTLVAGGGHADPDAVRALVTEGPAAIAALERRGVVFDRAADGRRMLGREGAHARARILHAGGDATGAEIQRGLLAECRARGVEIREHAFVSDVLLERGRAVGVRVLTGDGGASDLAADAVVLAAGGAGRVYARTTNPDIATGDGIALALRAGAAVSDMEFVQFHPTVLGCADGGEGDAFLVSEAVRGEGAVLIDDAGTRFVLDAHPDGELAPRDVVARAIARAMARQGGRPVRLDATALGAERLARRFPTIDRAVRERGLDWAADPIPVSPAAHYLMGGVVTDLDGRTSVPCLFAAGETARTGVHGANRLASNSLLEGAVFGARAGRAAAAGPDARAAARAERDGAGRVPIDAVPAPRAEEQFSRAALQELMWSAAGLSRDAASLERAARVIAGWRADLPSPRSVGAHEDRNLLDVAAEIVRAALARPASLGAHWRSDDAPAAARRPEPLLEAAA